VRRELASCADSENAGVLPYPISRIAMMANMMMTAARTQRPQ
jgi:hypothetical protein